MKKIFLTFILMLTSQSHAMNEPQLTEKKQDHSLVQEREALDFPVSIGINFSFSLKNEADTLIPTLSTSWSVTVEDTRGEIITHPMKISLDQNEIYSNKDYQAYSVGKTRKGFPAWFYFRDALWEHTKNKMNTPQKLKGLSLLKAEVELFGSYLSTTKTITVFDGAPYEVKRDDIQACPYFEPKEAMLVLEIDPQQNYKVTIPRSGLTVPSHQVKSND
jgi:hypothetical protein